MKNVITRAVGFEAEVDVDIYEMEVQPGDHFLLCSDGLSGLIEDVEIYRTLKESWGENRELSQTVKTLIQKANDNGGDDNISVILLKVME
jgi:protein phosphatase